MLLNFDQKIFLLIPGYMRRRRHRVDKVVERRSRSLVAKYGQCGALQFLEYKLSRISQHSALEQDDLRWMVLARMYESLKEQGNRRTEEKHHAKGQKEMA